MRKYGAPKPAGSTRSRRSGARPKSFREIPQHAQELAMFVRAMLGDDAELYVVGSIAKGRWDEYSDLDIAVMSPPPDGMALMLLAQAIGLATGYKVDIAWSGEKKDYYIEIPRIFKRVVKN